MTYRIVIPARHASARLPGKALALIDGVPMVVRVAQRALASPGAGEVIVATDHAAIRDAVAQAGIRVIMTSPQHTCGTDRVAEVAQREGWADNDVVVNVQGDEPLIPPRVIAQCASLLATDDVDLATLAWPVHDEAEFARPDVVKVVRDGADNALYFSRAPIPFTRERASSQDTALGYRHIGIYAYRINSLLKLSRAAPVAMEQRECLEQLRALWLGMRIRVANACELPPHGVDTPEDLAAIRARMATDPGG